MPDDPPRAALQRRPRPDAVDALAPPPEPTVAARPPKASRRSLVQVNTRLSVEVDDAMNASVLDGRYDSKQALIELSVRKELGLTPDR